MEESATPGAPRIHGELIMLGYDVSESTVATYMVKRTGRPTQNWFPREVESGREPVSMAAKDTTSLKSPKTLGGSPSQG